MKEFRDRLSAAGRRKDTTKSDQKAVAGCSWLEGREIWQVERRRRMKLFVDKTLLGWLLPMIDELSEPIDLVKRSTENAEDVPDGRTLISGDLTRVAIQIANS